MVSSLTGGMRFVQRTLDPGSMSEMSCGSVSICYHLGVDLSQVKQSVGSSFLAQKWFVYAFAKRRSAFIIAQDVSHQLCGDHGLCYASL